MIKQGLLAKTHSICISSVLNTRLRLQAVLSTTADVYASKKRVDSSQVFKKWRTNVIGKANKEEILSGFLNLDRENAEKYVEECFKISDIFKDKQEKLTAEMNMNPLFFSKIKISKGKETTTVGSVAKIGTREDGTINIIASDPSFTPLIKNAIMINVHGLNPINESDVVLIINSKSLALNSNDLTKQLKRLLDTTTKRLHEISAFAAKTSHKKRMSIDVNIACRNEIEEFRDALINHIMEVFDKKYQEINKK